VPGNAGNVAGFFPKISDFGLARLVEEHGQTITGAIVGTPAYMAPEQALGRTTEIGPPADVWALGVILYRCLSGKLPFTGDSVVETLEKVKAHAPPPLRQAVADVPVELEALCVRCLDKAPGNRPSAAELAGQLERFAATAESSPEQMPPKQIDNRPQRCRRSSRRLKVLAVCAVVFLTATAAWLAVAARHGATGLSIFGSAEGAPAHKARLAEVRVWHFARQGDKGVPRGELGKDSSATRFDDAVRLEVRLSARVRLYLVAFNPDGTEQLLWPALARDPGKGDPHTQPARVQRLVYPLGGDWFYLNDEPRGGLQALAVVASRQPLPPYAEWRARRGAAPWQRLPAGEGVWLADVEGTYLVQPGLEPLRGGVKPRLEPFRGGVKPLPGTPPLGQLVQSLHTEGVDWVEVVAFPVQPAGGK
jgi:hypothetical protein